MQFRIDAINPYEIRQTMRNEQISESAKVDILKHKPELLENPHILQNVQITMTKSEFAYLMKNRPLVRFKPIKNSFIKKGDKMLLAQSLNMPVSQVNNEIMDIIESNFELNDSRTRDNIEQVKTYIYRHGKKDEVIAFLKYELSDVKTVLQRLYKTLDDNTGGLCGYFQRPCHLMDNQTLEKVYKTVKGSLDEATKAGVISLSENEINAQWALKKIYQIQNDSRVIRAAKVVYNND